MQKIPQPVNAATFEDAQGKWTAGAKRPREEGGPHPPVENQSLGTESKLSCPQSRALRDRLRTLSAELVATWKAAGMPPAARTSAGLRRHAEALVVQAGAATQHVGWTMVTIVSEYWRGRLATGPSGRRLLLLPDCPTVAARPGIDAESRPPHVCGPGCVIGTLWAAARDCGWVVEATPRAVAAIGGLLTGQYDGILGVAKLSHLEKAFAMLPAFSLPIAAVPFDPVAVAASQDCDESVVARSFCGRAAATATLDPDWVLGLLGAANVGGVPAVDHLPLLREAAGLFTPNALQRIVAASGVPAALGEGGVTGGEVVALDATAWMAADFLGRGGKFLRPFITLATFDSLTADGAAGGDNAGDGARSAAGGLASGRRAAAQAAAVAVEIFHKASLIHDDIEDADRMRYGRATLHQDVGIPSAINAGDYLVGLGYRLASSLPGVDAAVQRDVVALLADAHVRLARGQGAELWWRDAAQKRLSSEEALTIYGLKTSPAFEVAVTIGVRLAGVDRGSAGAIDRYARHVGIGFQLLNDLKDWQGDRENDRRAAGDLLGGRPTLMWALARERLPAAELDRLDALAEAVRRDHAAGASETALIAEARRLYQQADVFSRAAAIVDDQRAAAVAAAATCRFARLREVLEFLLDLAVPDGAAAACLADCGVE
ncbi:MAG: hypothetical protein DWH79_07815 [Planctomycetota bacterium]|nr:MAG: hypothetical protein DWH79_07815 [Planctomycetota bacterium]